ncbi:MAG: YceI family protein [Bacteroidota bacterium]
MKKAAFSLFYLLIFAGAAFGQTGQWRLDKAHSSISFSVSHMVISEVTGSFRDFDIALSPSKDDFTDATITASINVASISTNNDRRDGHLKTDDFFNAEKYPQIKYTSTSFEKIDGKNYKIHGMLTIRDVTKEVTFDAVYEGSLQTAQGNLAAWKATTSINRFDYGLKWNRTIETGGLVAGETVTITLSLEFNRQST